MTAWISFVIDPYGTAAQKFPPLAGGTGLGYEASPGVGQASMSGSMMGSDMVMYPAAALLHFPKHVLFETPLASV